MAKERTAEQKAAHAKRERERRARLKAEANPMGSAPKAQAKPQAPATEAGSATEKAARVATRGLADLPAVPDGFKRCPRCGRVLPVEAFARNKASKDGLYSICKECEAADRKKAAALKKADADFNPAVLPGSKVISAGRSR